MNKQLQKFDVAICGGGMIGITAACLFTRQGLRTALIDQNALAQWSPETISPRVSALNIASINLFKSLGVWESISNKRISSYTNMVVWEDESNASISFDAASLSRPYLGCIVENCAIVDSIAEKLNQNYHFEKFENTALLNIEYADKGLGLQLDNGSTLNCTLLVGADGAQSRVRELSNIDTAFFDYDQEAIVTSVTLAQSHQDTAWQAFLPTGPVALLPLDDGRCSIVWSCDRKYAEALLNLNEKEFCTRLSAIFESQPGFITACSPRVHFPLRQHHAEQYISTNTALIGDAAHITHPLAGLGANIGFMDAASLSQVVESATDRNLDISRQSVLRRYERWRKGENSLVLNTMKGFKELFGSSLPAARFTRQTGIGIVNRLPPLKNQFARYAMGLAGDLPDNCKAAYSNQNGI